MMNKNHKPMMKSPSMAPKVDKDRSSQMEKLCHKGMAAVSYKQNKSKKR